MQPCARFLAYVQGHEDFDEWAEEDSPLRTRCPWTNIFHLMERHVEEKNMFVFVLNEHREIKIHAFFQRGETRYTDFSKRLPNNKMQQEHKVPHGLIHPLIPF